MDTAINFLTQHFKRGLCYPVWIDGNDVFVMRKVARRASIVGDDPAGFASSTTENGLLDHKSRNPISDGRKRHARSSARTSPVVESRDACAEMSLLVSLRDTSLDDNINDFDDVIAKIIHKRDVLIQENTQATQEIQRLKLENENLKNLNAIGKRISASQREELAQLKTAAKKDKTRISQLESTLEELRFRTNGVKSALEGGTFFGGFGSCKQKPINDVPDDLAVKASKSSPNSPGLLDSFFGWTLGSDE